MRKNTQVSTNQPIEWLRSKQAMEVLKVSRNKFHSLLKEGAIPVRRMNKRLFYINRADIDRYIQGYSQNQ